MRAKHSAQAEQTFLLLICTFIAVLLLTNIIVTKHFSIGTFVLTAGAITYPFTFSLLDIIS
ncbi:MAG: VUT family protein, partial [Bacteroidota bacterium]